MFKNRKRKGFTLIELVIVIAIIGILIAIAVPRFSDATQGAKNRRIDANARTIASAMTQSFADKQEWPTISSTPKEDPILKAAGIKEEERTLWSFKQEKNEIVITYTWADDEDKYTGTLGTTNSGKSPATFKF